MKLTMKIFLVISLFCSTAFADGEINQGQKDGDANGAGGSGGGFTCIECVIDNQPENIDDIVLTDKNDDSVFNMIKTFLSEMLG